MELDAIGGEFKQFNYVLNARKSIDDRKVTIYRRRSFSHFGRRSMAKRHSHSVSLSSRIRRIQELIMAHSGIDEFYEIIRLMFAKVYSEQQGSRLLPDIETCNRLLETNKEAITDIVDGVVTLQTPPDIFLEIRSILGEVSISKRDFTALDEAFELLTSRNYKADKGQFFTPRHVVDMCVEAINPQPGELVCDPACGSGAFLKSVYSYSKDRYQDVPALFGFDYSHRACQVSKAVSLLGADSKISVRQLDSLQSAEGDLYGSNSETIEKSMPPGFSGFDVIVTNPPFAGDVSSEKFSKQYELASFFKKRLERDLLFVERCVRLLKIGGRMAIVLPDNKVSGATFAPLRLWLGRNCEVNAVVSLHRYTFLPYTSQKAAVVFVTRKPFSVAPYDSEVQFLRSDKPGKTSNGSPIMLEGIEENLPPYVAMDHDLSAIAAKLKETVWKA